MTSLHQALLCREVLGSLMAAILVVLAAEHAQAIKWLSLRSAEGSGLWNSSAGCREARSAYSLTRGQTRLCRATPTALAVASRAASATLSVCQDLLRDRRWNCSSALNAPNFTPDLTTGTREQALVYALSAAAVTHAVARACAAGLVPLCGCAAPPSRPPEGAFQWGGCGDDLRWAQQFARQFVDSADRKPVEGGGDGQRRDLLALVNLHNNRAGRRAVARSMRQQCKCHGVSGSCSVRTCWRALPPRLADVGARLGRQYSRAVEVRDSLRHRLLPAHSRDDLLYFAKSPDYCHRDYRVGSVGTYGRKCNNSGVGSGSCASMCCGRGHVSLRVENIERCHCKYYWCCYVKCKTCRSWTQISQCL